MMLSSNGRDVSVDGQRLDPTPSQRLFNHSPDGFAWGYGGSGPAQLALAILLHAGVSNTLALTLHQRFKAAYITALPRGAAFTLYIDVPAWVAANTPTHVTPSEDVDVPMAERVTYAPPKGTA